MNTSPPLMIFMGFPYDSWNDYYYPYLNEIDNKALKIVYKAICLL